MAMVNHDDPRSRAKPLGALAAFGIDDPRPSLQTIKVPPGGKDSDWYFEPLGFGPKHPTLWHSDGDLIVSAGNQCTFKIHSEVVKANSAVLGSVLRDVQPHDVPDGYRVLVLHDHAIRLAELTATMYDSSSKKVFFNRDRAIPFDDLLNITPIAVKYECQGIIEEAIARLEWLFPTTYQRDRLDTKVLFSTTTQPGDLVKRDFYPAVPITAVALARAINPQNPPPFLVTALYYCTTFPAKQRNCSYYDADCIEEIVLSVDDIKLCAEASEALLRGNAIVLKPVFHAAEHGLCASADCRRALQRLAFELVRRDVLTDRDALRPHTDIWRILAECAPGVRPCMECEFATLENINEWRRWLFTQLGDIFGVDNWPARGQAQETLAASSHHTQATRADGPVFTSRQ